MREMFTSIENLNVIIDGVISTLVQPTPEDRYMARIIHARFILNSSRILSDLKEIEKLGDDELKGFLEKYLTEFKSAFRSVFVSKHGFGSVIAERYAECAAATMAEVIDSSLAIARQ